MKKLMTIALAVMLGGIMTEAVWAQTSNPTSTHAPAKKTTTTHKKTAKKRTTAKHRKQTAKKAPTSATKKNG